MEVSSHPEDNGVWLRKFYGSSQDGCDGGHPETIFKNSDLSSLATIILTTSITFLAQIISWVYATHDIIVAGVNTSSDVYVSITQSSAFDSKRGLIPIGQLPPLQTSETVESRTQSYFGKCLVPTLLQTNYNKSSWKITILWLGHMKSGWSTTWAWKMWWILRLQWINCPRS